MADVFVDGKVIVIADNRLFHDGHHLSLLQEDAVEFFGDVALQTCLSEADELTLSLWKAGACRSTPLEGGRLVAANVLRNLSAVAALEASLRPITSTTHSHGDKKFVTVFCSANYCRVLGLTDQEHVIFRLCTKVPNIERVVLCAQTAEAFRLAYEESFRAELRDAVTKHVLLCMEGCSFGICMSHCASGNQAELWEQLYVASCNPVCQGRLTETSEIVVKCCLCEPDISLSCSKKHSCNSCYSGCYDTDVEAAMVSDFAADIANNCSMLTSKKLDICLRNLKESMPMWVFNFAVLLDIQRVKSLITFQQSQDVLDEFSVAVFSRECAARLGIMNGNVLELSCKSHEHQQCNSRTSFTGAHQRSCRQRVVIAYVDTKHSIGDAEACISSSAWFNLCRMSCVSLSGSSDIQPCSLKVVYVMYTEFFAYWLYRAVSVRHSEVPP